MRGKSSRSEARRSTEVETIQSLLLTIGDTTWRMFVPAVGFTLLGVWLDSVFSTKPWLMFTGIVVGGLGAYLLVKQQVSRSQKLAEEMAREIKK